MLMIVQAEAAEPQIQIAQETVIAIIVSIDCRCARSAMANRPLCVQSAYRRRTATLWELLRCDLRHHDVLIGFLVAFPLVISNVFTDPTQVIALLSALFGTVVGLVGTYFGVKSSSDASQKAQDLSQKAQDLAQEATRMNIGRTDGTPNGAATVPTGATTAEETARTSTTSAGSTRDPGKKGPQGDRTDRDSPPQEESERNK
jgi:hypothetical protein